jgi:hypothetical protein
MAADTPDGKATSDEDAESATDKEREDSKRPLKEKVLHTRVDETLDSEIKDRAEQLGVSVSNLVRNVLQNAFGMVGDIVANSADIAKSARGEAVDRKEHAVPEVLGWQELELSRNALCATCNEILPKGTKAAVSVLDGPGERTILCLTCKEKS